MLLRDEKRADSRPGPLHDPCCGGRARGAGGGGGTAFTLRASARGGGKRQLVGAAGLCVGVEIATSFSKQDALDQFARVKRDHADILGAYEPMMVETCDLHMGTAPLYSARIGMESREYGDRLCAKLQADGGACIVQKN